MAAEQSTDEPRIRVTRRRRRSPWIGAGLVAAVLAAAWLTGAGAWIAGFAREHGYQRSPFGKSFEQALRDAFRPIDRRPARPVDSVSDRGHSQRIDALVARHFSKGPPLGRKLIASYVVQPDGTVSDARMESSTFDDPAFASAVVDDLRARRFAAGEWSATQFRYTYVSTREEEPAPSSPASPSTRPHLVPEPPSTAEPVRVERPLADVQAASDRDRARLEKVIARFYPDAASRKGRYLSATYVIQPDGTVTDAKIAASTYSNPEFEGAFLRELSKGSFPERPESAPTGYSLRFGDPGAIPKEGDPPPSRRPVPARIE